MRFVKSSSFLHLHHGQILFNILRTSHLIYIRLYKYHHWLVVLTLLTNISQWEGWHPIYEMENNKCSKPPTRYKHIITAHVTKFLNRTVCTLRCPIKTWQEIPTKFSSMDFPWLSQRKKTSICGFSQTTNLHLVDSLRLSYDFTTKTRNSTNSTRNSQRFSIVFSSFGPNFLIEMCRMGFWESMNSLRFRNQNDLERRHLRLDI